MNGVIRIVGPVDPEAARWACGLNDLAAGRLAIVVPPGLPSLAALVGELLGAMGKRADRNPLVSAAAETLELGLAWLAGHGIDRIVLVHADWLRDQIAAELCAFAALTGVDLACIVGDPRADPFLPWATAEQAWFEFVATETAAAGARAALAADPVRHQLDAVVGLGRPAGRVEVIPARFPEGVALAAYIALVGRIRLDGRTNAAVANSLHLVLRTFHAAELPDAVRGAATALAQAGWRLRYDPVAPEAETRPAWADLRTAIHPYRGAAVALVATGLWVSEIPRVIVSEVALDGATLRHAGHDLPVPAGARAYLAAQRRLAVDASGPFLVHRGRPLTSRGAEDAVTAAMAEAGQAVDGDLLHRPTTPGLRWLAARGLMLDRVEASGEPVLMARRCRHGLAGQFEVDGVLLGHSQRLCHTVGSPDRHPWVVRPEAGGFELEELESSAQGVRIAVSRNGSPAGELIGLAVDDGPVWLQTGVGRAPAIDRIAGVVRACHGLSIR